MGKVGAFLDHGRETHTERAIGERTHDFGEIAQLLPMDEQQVQASRCMMCGVAFCQAGVSFGTARPSGCPLHNLIPEFNDLLWRGELDQAAARLRMTNPFPEFTGRVCPALCEAACNLGRDREATTIKDNERAISDFEWAAGGPAPFDARAKRLGGKRVTVVGSGPAGLAAAWELARQGATVTVVERAEVAGGLLSRGIPPMKLPQEVVSRRIAWLEDQGVNFELGVDAADPEVAAGIMASSDAVVLAVGAREARMLKVPGAEGPGVVMALDFLGASEAAVAEVRAAEGEAGAGVAAPATTSAASASASAPAPAASAVTASVPSSLSAAGKRVVVIGGGDTGTDCVATAIREGATSVLQLEFLPQPPRERAATNGWPEWPATLKTDYGQQEAAYLEGCDPRRFGIDTQAVVRDSEGTIQGLTIKQLDWSSGAPVPVPDSDEFIPADLVIVAMGFVGAQTATLDAYGVAQDPCRPVAATLPGSHLALMQTDSPSAAPVYIAGDCGSGASLVVNAIASGLEAAREAANALG